MSVPCRHFARGFCQLGNACGFLHPGANDVPAFQNWDNGFGMPDAKKRCVSKTQICRHWEKGFCQLGEGCGFAHGEHELGQQGIAPASGTTTARMVPSGGYLKTKLCTIFASQGSCHRGAACTFAHGEAELGTPQVASTALGGSLQEDGMSDEDRLLMQQLLEGQPSTVPQGSRLAPQLGGGQQGPVFMKTKLCTNFAGGYCTRGTFCTFAHGEHELGTPQPAGKAAPQPGGKTPQVVKPPVWSNYTPPSQQQRQYKKTKICTNFESGFCPRGDACTFAHGEEELGTPQPAGFAELHSVARPQLQAGGGWGATWQVQTARAPQGQVFKKTKLCHHFESQGACSRGEMCCFAHGQHELGTPQPTGNAVHAATPSGPTQADKELFNYKTMLCNNFTNSGSCPRGDQCSFAHGQDELMEPGQAKLVVEQMEQEP
jgi:hypothetical protein